MGELTEYQKYTNGLLDNGAGTTSLKEVPIAPTDTKEAQLLSDRQERIIVDKYDLAKARNQERDHTLVALAQVRAQIAQETDKKGFIHTGVRKIAGFAAAEIPQLAKNSTKHILDRKHIKKSIVRSIIVALSLIDLGLAYDFAVKQEIIPDFPKQIRGKTDDLKSQIDYVYHNPITVARDILKNLQAQEQAVTEREHAENLWNTFIKKPYEFFSLETLNQSNVINLIDKKSGKEPVVIFTARYGPLWWMRFLEPFPTSGNSSQDKQTEDVRQAALEAWRKILGEKNIADLGKYQEHPNRVWSRLKDLGYPSHIYQLYRMNNDSKTQDFKDFQKWKNGDYDGIESRPYEKPQGGLKYFNPQANAMSVNELTPTQKARNLQLKGKPGKNVWKTNRI